MSNSSHQLHYNGSIQLLLRRTFAHVLLLSSDSGAQNNHGAPFDAPSSNDTFNVRMNVNQITFAILISVLLVADMFLIWSLGYLVVYYERRGRMVLRHYNAIKQQARQRSDISALHQGSQL